MMDSRWFITGGKTREKVDWLKDRISTLRETNDNLRVEIKKTQDTILVNDRLIAEMVIKLNEWEVDCDGRLQE